MRDRHRASNRTKRRPFGLAAWIGFYSGCLLGRKDLTCCFAAVFEPLKIFRRSPASRSGTMTRMPTATNVFGFGSIPLPSPQSTSQALMGLPELSLDVGLMNRKIPSRPSESEDESLPKLTRGWRRGDRKCLHGGRPCAGIQSAKREIERRLEQCQEVLQSRIPSAAEVQAPNSGCLTEFAWKVETSIATQHIMKNSKTKEQRKSEYGHQTEVALRNCTDQLPQHNGGASARHIKNARICQPGVDQQQKMSRNNRKNNPCRTGSECGFSVTAGSVQPISI